MSIVSLTTSKTPGIASDSASQPIPMHAGDMTRLTERLARLRIGVEAPLESTLQSRVTIQQAPPNTPDGSPRERSEDLFLEAFEPDFMEISDIESPIKPSTIGESKTDDFEPLITSRSFANPRVTLTLPQSRFRGEGSLETDKIILDQPSIPRTAPTFVPVANPIPIVPMPSPPLAPIKRRPPKEKSLSRETIPETKDLSKKRIRDAEEAPPAENQRRVRARLMFEDLPKEEKKDDSYIYPKPVKKKIDFKLSLPFCSDDQIPMFYNFFIHPFTNVWSAHDGNKGRVGKIASFLPPEIDKNEFETLLEIAVSSGCGCIVQQGNKGLFQFGMDETFVVIEVSMLGGTIDSVQPIFHFENYDQTKESIRVDYFSQEFVDKPVLPGVYELPYSQLLDLLRAPTSIEFPIAYQTEDTLFVDVAILDKDCPFKGLIIAIPRSVVENRMEFSI